MSRSVVSNSCDPMDYTHEAPLSVEFSRQEYWSGLPFPSPGDLPSSGMEPWSPALQADSIPAEPPGKHVCNMCIYNIIRKQMEFKWQLHFSSIRINIFSFRVNRLSGEQGVLESVMKTPSAK